MSNFASHIATAEQNSGGSALFTFGFMALIGLAMYFLMIRPQRKRLRAQQELQQAITVDDEIITNSGLYGFVTAMDGDIVWLEIAENVEIRISRNALLRRVNPAEEPAGGEPTEPTTPASE
jgi:preprotein translocase subunit YajC